MEQEALNLKIFNLLHMARKAGTVKFGLQETERMILAQKAKLVLIANDLSEHSKKKLNRVITNQPCSYFSTKEEISIQLNRKETGILCVIDKNFANGIANLLTLRMED